MTLPVGFVVRVARGVRIRDRGRTLIGGAPLRVVRLGPAARRILSRGKLVVSEPAAGVLAERLLTSGVAEPVVDALPPVPLDDVTCVVPVHDRVDALDRLLESLDRRVRVLVVDDASHASQEVRRVVERHGASLIRREINGGPAAARNTGLAQVRTPLVLFVDSDVVVSEQTLRHLARHFTDPKVALVAPRVRPLGDDRSVVGRYEAVCSSLDMGRRSALVRPLSAVSWVPSAAVMARRAAIGAGFDDAMRSGEDVDLAWRLISEGWRVRYDADVAVHHEHRTATMDWLARKAFYGTSAAGLAARHGSAVAPAVVTPIQALISLSLLAQRRWSIPLGAALASLVVVRTRAKLHRIERPGAVAAELTCGALMATSRQMSQLLLRHWWPLAAVASVRSRRMRRAVVVCAVVQSLVDFRRHEPNLDPLRFALTARLDDLAYGVGLWRGVIRSRSVAALRPRWAATAMR